MNPLQLFNPFRAPSQSTGNWFFIGLTSSFPNLDSDAGDLSELRTCSADKTPGCKVFHISAEDSSQGSEVPIASATVETLEVDADLKDQVLVFQYRGKIHAVDHRCPHSSYPLSNGVPFDIEDFGIILSAGLTCPKHGWSFDLFTGNADRGNYKLPVWEVQLREPANREQTVDDEKTDETSHTPEKEVWVRRKQRIG